MNLEIIFPFCLMPTKNLSSKILLRVIHHQLTFTCSKSTIETMKKGLKYVQNNKKTLQQRH